MSEALLFDNETQLGEYLATIRVPSEILDLGTAAAERYYEWCLKSGGTPKDSFAETLAIWYARQSSVGSGGTDRAFQEGQISRYTGNEAWLIKAKEKYRKATGHDVPSGAVYISQIATHPGDPRAWVTDIGEVKKRAQELGHGIDDLRVKENLSQVKRVRIAEDIVQRHLRKEVANPENIGKDVRELREKVVETHAYDASNLE